MQVDRRTATALSEAFSAFDADPDSRVAILTGAGGTFCSGADLSAVLAQDPERMNLASYDMNDLGPMGITRIKLSKPVIACCEGYAVAGGLELACWADLRVASADAVFGGEA